VLGHHNASTVSALSEKYEALSAADIFSGDLADRLTFDVVHFLCQKGMYLLFLSHNNI
jgi:hypothetical protein